MARIDEVLAGEKTWGQYALDMLGHAGLGAAYSLVAIVPAVLFADFGFLLCMAVGEPLALLGGALREWVQSTKAKHPHPLDRVLDVLHHILGPPIAYGLVRVVVALA
jgi:hypothetical protein